MWATEHVSSKTAVKLWFHFCGQKKETDKLFAGGCMLLLYQMYISNLKRDFGFVTAVLYTYTELCSSVYSEIR